MPPVLDPKKSKVDGLAFLGLSLCRKSDEYGHPDSITHQTAYDLNDILDREYKYIFSTNDDGWLVGGGEPGPPDTYKLPAKDSAHVELMRIGTYRPEWGGISQQEIIDIGMSAVTLLLLDCISVVVVVSVMMSGKILIPQIEVVPTAVVANGDLPPELEIRFDMMGEDKGGLPYNWSLRFIHNQLFRHFQNPSRFCPGAFHSTIVRKAEFRSEGHRDQYFAKCASAISKWSRLGPQALNTEGNDVDGTPLKNDSSTMTKYTSGLWLFTDRTTITHFFPPNFLPPYDTPDKQNIIQHFLKEEWDESTLSWKPTSFTDK